MSAKLISVAIGAALSAACRGASPADSSAQTVPKSTATAPQSPQELAAMLAEDREAAFVTVLKLHNCDRRHAEEILAWLEAGNRQLP